MLSPQIKIFETKLQFKYLWAKYVTGVNLDVHCAKCLLGQYSKKVAPNKCVINVTFDEHQSKYYYICGVSKPYVWANNFHVAFEYAPNNILDYCDGNTRIVIENARQIPIRTQDYRSARFGQNRSYTTCRNWQFAYQIRDKL